MTCFLKEMFSLINQGGEIIGPLVHFPFPLLFLSFTLVGYFDKRKDSNGETLLDRIGAQLDKELAYINEQPVFVVIHSLAGGTGSDIFCFNEV